MTKIKTLGATVLLVAAVAAPVFAQDGRALESRYGWEPSSSWNSEMPGMNSLRRNSRWPVRYQQSLEPHRPSRSRHQQQPGWKCRRRVTTRSTLNEGPRRHRGPFNPAKVAEQFLPVILSKACIYWSRWPAAHSR
jgi:hypothetical protein